MTAARDIAAKLGDARHGNLYRRKGIKYGTGEPPDVDALQRRREAEEQGQPPLAQRAINCPRNRAEMAEQ